MNYEPFRKLAKEAIRYMNPENDWRFIHADTYTFYNLTSFNTYKSSFPLWKELHDECFGEIRQYFDPDCLIDNLTLVVANEHTVCHPVREYSGIMTLEGSAHAAVMKVDQSRDDNAFHDTKISMYRRMYCHSPHLVPWQNYNQFGFEVNMEKPLFPGQAIFNYYPKPGTIFFYYGIKGNKGQRYGTVVKD
tara:strand:- start:85 stop:654 length:570 start_codon:yes stop_codon:yes gene_type:complete